ncbi:MAG: hypothetical protein HY340_00280 [Candidatus Kerfeldbacteria bacterium]|nr:hypothetical protein [Candidatus Kerfeldbacteria bacterium]
MHTAERNTFFHNHPHRRGLWVSVFVMQIAGLVAVLVFAPVTLTRISHGIVPLTAAELFARHNLFVLSAFLFGVLAVLNALAVAAIWRVSRLAQLYLIIKLGVVLLLVLSVFFLIPDYLLLGVYLVLTGLLGYMIVAYQLVSRSTAVSIVRVKR